MSAPPPRGDELRQRLAQASTRALACGALRPIATRYALHRQAGVSFQLRVLRSLARKQAAGRAARSSAPAPANPFLPHDPRLFVARIRPAHLALLNKFNVLDDHLLLVTETFEHQEHLLTRGDFLALWTCMQQIDGLAFYNGGEVAGASQPHKHLQLVPLPLAPTGPAIPMASLFPRDAPPGQPLLLPGVPFVQVFASLAPMEEPALAAPRLHALYLQLLAAAGLEARGEKTTAPYNLLLTRRWMVMVPRACEHFEGISINALGFAGALLVRDQRQLDRLRAAGPMAVLRHVGLDIV